MTDPIQHLRELMSKAKFGALSCDNYFPSEIFEKTATGPAKAVEIRGWGWLQKQEDGEQMQDARGRLVCELLNLAPQLLEVVDRVKTYERFHGDPVAGYVAQCALFDALAALGGKGEG